MTEKEPKTMLQSKTVIVNGAAILVTMILQSKCGMIISAQTQVYIITLLNIALRAITNEPIKLK